MGFELKRNTSSIIKGSVEFHADLSSILNPSINDYYLVRKGSGIPFVNRKSSGLYFWDGSDWVDDDKNIISKVSTIESSTASNTTGLASLTSLLNSEITNRENGDEGSVSIHSDMDIPSGSTDAKEALFNNGSGVFSPRKITLLDISEYDLMNVTPKDGWINKYFQGKLIPCMKEVFEFRNLVVNASAFFNLVVIDENIEFQREGKYNINVSFGTSYDVTNTDFIAEMLLDGNGISSLSSNEIFRYEPKDSAGFSPDGRGTNQKMFFNMNYTVDISDIGFKNLVLQFRPQANNQEASLWDAVITIEEIF